MNHLLTEKIELANRGWRPVSWIPNQEGYLIWGAMRDGTIKPLSVRKNRDGLHTISEGQFSNLLAWKERVK